MTTPTTPAPDTIPPARPSGLYPLGTATWETANHWDAIRGGGPADPHRAYLKHLVAQALRDGLRYTDDVQARVIADLGDLLTDELRARGTQRVHGGVIGMEIYYARELLRDEQRKRDLAAAGPAPVLDHHI